MQKNLRYAMYLRKSTDSEDRQKASIAAQREELQQLALRSGLQIVAEYTESKSAKRPGRLEFSKMISALDEREVDGILCWHLDRLARNSLDGAQIIWRLSEGTIKEILTPHDVYDGKSDDKLMMHIKFGMAEKYVDDLSRNIQRGNRRALVEGRWPNRPPVGYARVDRETMVVGRDPERFEMVKELWRLRLSGAPVMELLQRSHTWGLTMPRYRTHGGKKLSPSQLYAMFKNPFYAGMMRYNGEEYPGRHEAMVTWTQFEAVQEMLEKSRGRGLRPKTRAQERFLYQELLSCGSCGAVVTSERTRNRYGKTYLHYHCCRKNRRYKYCPERSVQEHEITAAIAEALGGLRIPPAAAAEVQRLLAHGDAEAEQARADQLHRVVVERGRATARRDRLTDMCAEGAISTEELLEKRAEIDRELRLLDEQERELGETRSLIEPFDALLARLNKAKNRFESGSGEEKRDLARWAFSNLEIRSRKVLCRPKKILEILSSGGDISTLCSR